MEKKEGQKSRGTIPLKRYQSKKKLVINWFGALAYMLCAYATAELGTRFFYVSCL
jgi:hypothetical protein